MALSVTSSVFKICILIMQIIAVAPLDRYSVLDTLQKWVDSRMPCKFETAVGRSVCPVIGPTDWFIGIDVTAEQVDGSHLVPFAVYEQILKPLLVRWLKNMQLKFGPNDHRIAVLYNNVSSENIIFRRPDKIDCKRVIKSNSNELNLMGQDDRAAFRPATNAPIMEVVRLHVQKCSKMKKQRVIILFTYTPTAASFRSTTDRLRLLYISPHNHRPPSFFMVYSSPYSRQAQFELEHPFENTTVNGSLYIPCESNNCAPVDLNRMKLLASYLSNCICSASEDCAYDRKNYTTIKHCHFLMDKSGQERCAAVIKPKISFTPAKRSRNPWSKKCFTKIYNDCDQQLCVADCALNVWTEWTKCYAGKFYGRHRQRTRSNSSVITNFTKSCPDATHEYCTLPYKVKLSSTSTNSPIIPLSTSRIATPATLTDSDSIDTTIEEYSDDESYKNRVGILTWILIILSAVLILVLTVSYVMIKRERIKTDRYRRYRRHRKKKDSHSSLTLVPVTISPTSSKTKTSVDEGGTTCTKTTGTKTTTTKKTKKSKSSN